MRRAVLLLALCATGALAQEAAPEAAPAPAATPAPAPALMPSLNLTYQVSWGSFSLGDATVTLAPTADANCYRYQTSTKPVGLVRVFYGAPTEVSDFCMVGGKVQPRHFEYMNVSDSERSFKLDFDWAARKVRIDGGEPHDMPDNAVDRHVLQQAVRLWAMDNAGRAEPGSVEFTMIDRDRTKVYRFAITKRESVMVPAGQFDTLLVERVDDPGKSSKFWLAPSRDYMPVKVEQAKQGRPLLRMMLKG